MNWNKNFSIISSKLWNFPWKETFMAAVQRLKTFIRWLWKAICIYVERALSATNFSFKKVFLLLAKMACLKKNTENISCLRKPYLLRFHKMAADRQTDRPRSLIIGFRNQMAGVIKSNVIRKGRKTHLRYQYNFQPAHSIKIS